MKLQTSLYAVLTALAAVSVSAGPTPGPAGRNTITKIQDTKTIVDAIKSDDYQGDAKSKGQELGKSVTGIRNGQDTWIGALSEWKTDCSNVLKLYTQASDEIVSLSEAFVDIVNSDPVQENRPSVAFPFDAVQRKFENKGKNSLAKAVTNLCRGEDPDNLIKPSSKRAVQALEDVHQAFLNDKSVDDEDDE